MARKLRGLLVLGVVLTGGLGVGRAADDRVDNPRYKFWANFKSGATSTYTQMTKFHAKICYSDAVPGGVVLNTRTTKEGDTVIAEITTTLKSFAESEPDK